MFVKKYNDHTSAVWAAVRADELAEKEKKNLQRKEADLAAAAEERATEWETIRRPLWVRLQQA
eukprot:5972207-Prymnesium_polylepis.1